LWAAGFSAIPLLPRQKMPKVKGWSAFAQELPGKDVQDVWMLFEGMDGSNVGVAMGPASGVVALDIDTDDPLVLGIMQAVLPPSPWERVGKKGKVWLYKWESGVRTFRVDAADGSRLFELLSAGTQVVVPPSIHPDTGRAYYANCDLAGVKREDIRPLPAGIEAMIRDALENAGVALRGGASGGGAASTAKLRTGDWIAAGSRDTQMTAEAGVLARTVTNGRRTLLVAMNEIKVWIDRFTEKVHGDELSVDKAQRKVCEFVLRDVTGPRKLTLPEGWDAGLTEDDKTALGLGILTEGSRCWAGHEIVKFMTVELARPDVVGNQVALNRLAQEATERLASNPGMSAIEKDGLIRYIALSTGTHIVGIRKMLTTKRPGEIEGTNHNEIAVAALADLQAYGEIRFHNGKFWQWQGSHWAVYDEDKIVSHLAKEYSEYPAAKKQHDHESCVKVMQKDSDVRKPLSEMASLCGINFVNGFLTDAGELRPHNPDFGMTYVLPYAYRGELADACPKWFKMLKDFWGDDEDYLDKVKLLQEAFAVTLFGAAPAFQMAFMLYGVAHSGKTQIREVLEGLMPAGCRSLVPPTAWGDKFQPVQLDGKLLNIGGDISETLMIDGEKFKQIIGGEEISVQRKHKDPFDMKPKCTHWFLGNHLPRTRDSSDGFTRRIMFLKFNQPFTKASGVKINDYGRMVVAEEREAITAWAVEGMWRLKQRGGFTEPKSHLSCALDVARQNNNVLSFIVGLQEQGCILLGTQAHRGRNVNSTPVRDLFYVYRSYSAKMGGAPHVGPETFSARLDELQGRFGFELRKVAGLSGGAQPTCLWLTIVDATSKRASLSIVPSGNEVCTTSTA
jgi:P4 family phage/plasmid primase-like protien